MLFNFLLQVAIAGGQNSRIGLDLGVGPNSLKAPILRDAQQLGLQLRGHLRDLIEKDRSTIGVLEPPNALCRSAGESASLMAEQFALQQRLWNGGAIHFHQRSGSARAPGVDNISQNFLADTAFACDQNTALGRCDQ